MDLFQASGVAQSSDETVVGLKQRRVGVDGFAEGLGRLNCVASGQQVEAALG